MLATFEAEAGVGVGAACAICAIPVPPLGIVPGSVLCPPPIFPEHAAKSAAATIGHESRV
jgi:hypothetical protein